MTTDNLRWEDPPAQRIDDVVAALRSRPFTWAVVVTVPVRSGAVRIKEVLTGGYFLGGKRGAIEAVIREVDREYRVYARYVGRPTS